MCGLCGVVHHDGQAVAAEQILHMQYCLRHRGPDDQGQFIEDNIGLGFVRLSILDLSNAGHQPMISQDGRYVLTYNGEIYNYLELREQLLYLGHRFVSDSDSEVVLAAYRQWGCDCFERFNGMFALAIYDRDSGELLLARDRYGIKPLYLAHDGGRLLFASEITPILTQLSPQKRRADQQAIFDYLVYERIDHTEQSFFSGIEKLPPGTWLRYKDGRFQQQRWYHLRERCREAQPFADAEEYREALDDALRLTLRSDVPVGVSLSGGLDSSSIVALLQHRYGMRDLQTFSAVYGRGQPGDESRYIDAFNDQLQHQQRVTPDAASLMEDLTHFVDVHQEPVPRTGPYAQYKVMQLAQGHVKVTLDGQGADETLAGYKPLLGVYHRQLWRQGRWSTWWNEVSSSLRTPGGMGGLSSGIYAALPEGAREALLRRKRRLVDPLFYQQFRPESRVPQMLPDSDSLQDALIDMVGHKLEHLLKWGDRNSMAFSIESRVPFLDYRLVERTLALPPEELIQNSQGKWIMRQALSGILPEKIRKRRDKIGFGTPENDWLCSDAFQELVGEVLNSDFYRHNPYIDTDMAKVAYERHVCGRINIARDIWKWIHLYLWHQRFINGLALPHFSVCSFDSWRSSNERAA